MKFQEALLHRELLLHRLGMPVDQSAIFRKVQVPSQVIHNCLVCLLVAHRARKICNFRAR